MIASGYRSFGGSPIATVWAIALLIGMVALVAAARPAKAQDQIPVDLELVLAVDVSSSIDNAEYRLQMQGIAAAFRDRDIQAAITGGPLGSIAVGLVLWAEAEVPKRFTGWYHLTSVEDAEAFAVTVERFRRRIAGGTGIGSGIGYAIRMIEGNGYAGTRKVVDVSGDGPETPPREYVVMLPQARSMALLTGVTVNGLAILNETPDLDRWYRENVITGNGSFVISAARMEDFAEAMRRKLFREIQSMPSVSGLSSPARPQALQPGKISTILR